MDLVDIFVYGQVDQHRAITRALENASKDLPEMVRGQDNLIRLYFRYVMMIREALLAHHITEDMVVFPTVRGFNDPNATLVKETAEHEWLAVKLKELDELVSPLRIQLEPLTDAELDKVVPSVALIFEKICDPQNGHFVTEEKAVSAEVLRTHLSEEGMIRMNLEMSRAFALFRQNSSSHEMDNFAFLAFHMKPEESRSVCRRYELTSNQFASVFASVVRADEKFWRAFPTMPKVNFWDKLVLDGNIKRSPMSIFDKGTRN